MKILFIPLHIIRYVQNTFNMSTSYLTKLKRSIRFFFISMICRSKNTEGFKGIPVSDKQSKSSASLRV